MSRTVSITRYITTRVISLLAVLVIIYSVMVERVYQWGVQDMRHYFMSLEADDILAELKNDGKFLSIATEPSEYFLSWKDVPKNIKQLLPQEFHQEGELLLANSHDLTYYLLPYRHPNTRNNKRENSNEYFYVLQTYKESEDDYQVDYQVSDVQIFIGILALMAVFLLVKNLAWSIILPVKRVEKWATEITDDNNKRIALTASELKFNELKTVANRLHQSINQIEAKTQQEKKFLQTLSHELRTPLAITKAALELMTTTPDGLNDKHLLKLERMTRANNNMLSTTECLLWLWTGKNVAHKTESIQLLPLVQEMVTNNDYLLRHKPVEIIINIASSLPVVTEKTLLIMVIRNLIRNAFQYAHDGKIKICADKNSLTIENSVANIASGFTQKNQQELPDYGYGIGLYLVAEICTQKNWALQIKSDTAIFSVVIQWQ